MIQEMNLTPSRVEELRELGVEFKGLETSCSWLLDSVGTWTIENTETAQWYYATPNSIYEKIISAPSLQEMLYIIPKTIKITTITGFDILFFDLEFNNGNFCVNYYNSEGITQIEFCNPNPLIAAYELLKWVAINCPSSLINKTE